MFLMPLYFGSIIEPFVYMLVQGLDLSGVNESTLRGDGRCLDVGAEVACYIWRGCPFI